MGIRRITVVAVATLVVVAGLGSGAFAGKGGNNSINTVGRSDKSASKLARAIFEGNRDKLFNAKFVTTPPGNNPVGISSKQLSGFPRKGGKFAILTTGCARLADNPNNSKSTGCRDGGLKIRGARDVTIWRIRLDVPKQANCLSFRFKFFSDEFPEFVGSEFNDAFIAELSNAPRWNATSKNDPTIKAPRNFATTAKGDLISINGTGVARVSRKRSKGTTYDAATRKLRASTPVKPGKQLLHLSIFDQGDRQYDSAVFIDRMLVRKNNNCESGIVGSK